jgi:hypothetical protein
MSGNIIPTLVVGGAPSFVNETAKKKLAKWGLSVEWHVEMGKGRQESNPHADARCEAIIVFSDMVSTRDVSKAWLAFANERHIPIVILDRHESHWPKQFERFGFRTIPAVAAAAVAAPEEQDMPQQQRSAPSGSPEYRQRIAFLKEQLRELAEEDGVQSLSWDAKSNVVSVRREVRMVQEEML